MKGISPSYIACTSTQLCIQLSLRTCGAHTKFPDSRFRFAYRKALWGRERHRISLVAQPPPPLLDMLKLLLRARDQSWDRQNALFQNLCEPRSFPAQEGQSCLRSVQCQQGEVSWRSSSVQAVRRQIPTLSLQPRQADRKTARKQEQKDT